ncbi:hypothetical protein EYF80_064952 [Liparis tanakae]|uniref:Uncharacterized protein n=1 Tax=Liparis tanakae TaxID=230148 RepID=A0A4Z2E836_9TELE|nr:hypothetical protein EYF80_064952 [Liparis tanakae]
MLTKDTKPDEKGGAKEAMQVIPLRPDTPEMFKAALKAPPPSPTPDLGDAVSRAADGALVVRTTAAPRGEQLLSVETQE